MQPLFQLCVEDDVLDRLIGCLLYTSHGDKVFHHLLAGVRVQAGSDLIRNDEVIAAQGQPGDADALALAAGTTSACTKISQTNSWPTPLQLSLIHI